MLAFVLSIADTDDKHHLLHIYHSYHRELLAVAASVLGADRRSEAEDAVQNAYLNLHKYRHRLDACADDDRLHAYAVTVVKNEARRLLVSRHVSEDIDEYSNILISDDDFVRRIEQTEQYEHLVCCIMRLDDRYRIPLYLRYVEELPVKRIAHMINCPAKTVYTNLSRGKAILIKMLEDRVP